MLLGFYQMLAALQRIGRETSPFVAVPRPDAKDAEWVEPRLVCESSSRPGPVTAASGIRALRCSARTSLRGR